MKIQIALASLLAAVAFASLASAQTPPRAPTQEECDKGWNAASGLTKEQFTKACAEMKSKKP
jgi:hypothetical protein